MNNLDRQVAQYPQELVTYGGNGQVFSNWAQVRGRLRFFLQNQLQEDTREKFLEILGYLSVSIGTDFTQTCISVVFESLTYSHTRAPGCCCQFRLTMHYLSTMTSEQTLVMYSGHPLGLFPSTPDAPRAIITNGMVSSSTSLDHLI